MVSTLRTSEGPNWKILNIAFEDISSSSYAFSNISDKYNIFTTQEVVMCQVLRTGRQVTFSNIFITRPIHRLDFRTRY